MRLNCVIHAIVSSQLTEKEWWETTPLPPPAPPNCVQSFALRFNGSEGSPESAGDEGGHAAVSTVGLQVSGCVCMCVCVCACVCRRNMAVV